MDIQEIKFNNPKFPRLLKTISRPPKHIFLRGEIPSEGIFAAIVGTRKATASGKQLAKEWAEKLAEMGIIVVSGLALGIDSAAHEGAIATGGKTIAVLANGADKIYPAQNENLAKKILELGGAIISEYEPKTPALPHQFLERNRLISGLSIATIVIEAPERSGAIATARLAAEQGREVFVVPGPVEHPNYKGAHQLIRDGARLITSIEDILEDLGLNDLGRQKLNLNNAAKLSEDEYLNASQLKIIETIRQAGKPLAIDEIIKMTKLDASVANQAVAFLTIGEIIAETEQGYGLR